MLCINLEQHWARLKLRHVKSIREWFVFITLLCILENMSIYSQPFNNSKYI